MNIKHYPNRRKRVQAKIRSKISGTLDRPRLSVFRSTKHIYAQIIDDVKGKTLVAVSDLIVSEKKGSPKTEKAAVVGKELALKAKKLNVSKVVFDRSGYKYHGRIRALADAARKEGLSF